MMRLTSKPLLVVALAGTVLAMPALAQQSSSGYPPPCDPSKVSKSDVDRAHTVFLSGKQYLEESNYDKAISYFKDAYSIDCSVHGILPIIATSYERKGDKAEAVRALEEYLRRAPSAPDHEVIERRIRNLNDQLAREQPTATAPLPSTSSTASSAPTAAPPPSADLPPTPMAAATPSPAPSPGGTVTESSGHTAAPWVLVGAGGAAAVAGAVVWGVGAGDVSSAENACPSRKGCTPDVVSKGNGGRSTETVGAVVGLVGVVAVAGGLAWHFSESTGPRAAQVIPVAGPRYAGVSVGGSF
jgi:hypothetical protein